VLALIAATACGGAPLAPTPPAPPARAVTAGDALLALLPAGADAVAELDVARLRANPTIGAAALALEPRLGDVDAAVVAVYRLAEADARPVLVVRGAGLAQLPERLVERGTWRDERTLLVGTPPPAATTLAADPAFLALRAAAMPAKAAGATLRLTARLSRSARVTAAGRLGVDELPATLSLWLDVADDAALIALLGGDDEADAAHLAELARDAHARADHLLPPWLRSARLAGELTARTAGRGARVVWLLGPRRLAEWARRAKEGT
jgi:hypothetical protein